MTRAFDPHVPRVLPRPQAVPEGLDRDAFGFPLRPGSFRYPSDQLAGDPHRELDSGEWREAIRGTPYEEDDRL